MGVLLGVRLKIAAHCVGIHGHCNWSISARDHAEVAVTELRKQGVPDDSIVFSTRSEGEAKTIAKQFGATVGGLVGGATGMSAGVVAAALLLPGVGAGVCPRIRSGCTLGLAGAGAGAGVGSLAAQDKESPSTHGWWKSFRGCWLLREGAEGRALFDRSSDRITRDCRRCRTVLDGLGIGMQGKTPVRMQTKSRQIGDVVVLDISGGSHSAKATSCCAILSAIYPTRARAESF